MNENSMNNAVTMRPNVGASLGRIDQYELIRELGGGGFGCVYLARDTVAGIEVAVKGLPPLVRLNKEELENVRKNFALVSRLHHPNIAAALTLHPVAQALYDDKSDAEKLRVFGGDTLVVMQYAPGVTLSQWRKQFPEGKVPLDKALEITRQIASALDYAHEEKILHRDIKPANVMIETGGDGKITARVLDFGLAAEIRSSMSRVSQSITDTSGTRPYMAPEQWGGRKQGKETDLYSLAVLFYELVSGEVPFASVFDTGDPVLMMNVVGREEPEISSDLSKPIRLALSKALAKKREDRFGSCSEFVDALEGGMARSKTASRSEVARGLRAAVILTAVAALGLAVGGVWYWQSAKAKEEARIVAEQKAEEERKVAEEARRIAAEKAKAEKAERERIQKEEEAQIVAEQKAERNAELEVFRLSSKVKSAHELIDQESMEIKEFFATEIRAFENDRRAGDDAKQNSKYVIATNFYAQALSSATALKVSVTKYRDCKELLLKIERAKQQADEAKAAELLPDRYKELSQKYDSVLLAFESKKFGNVIADIESLSNRYLALCAEIVKIQERKKQEQLKLQIATLEQKAAECLRNSQWYELEKITAELIRLDGASIVAQKYRAVLEEREIKDDLELKKRVLKYCSKDYKDKNLSWFRDAKKRLYHFDFVRFENYDDTWSLVGDVIRIGGGITEVKYLIENKGLSVSRLEGYNKQSLLFTAVENDNLSLVKYLINKGVDINLKEMYAGRIPLDAAKSLPVAEVLVSEGSDLDVTMKFSGDKEPYRIADRKSYEIMRFLCTKGAKLTDPAMIYKKAAEAGDIQFLKENKDCVKNIPKLIFYALNGGKMDVIRWLESLGQDFSGVMKDGRCALHFCTSTNTTLEAYQYAFAKCNQENVNVKDKEGRTPLFFVKNIEIARFLLEKGASFTIKSNTGSDTPLSMAYFYNISIFKFFVESGADFMAPNSAGVTYFHLAVWNSDHELVEFLLKHNANPNMILPKDNGWQSALLAAVANKDVKMVEILIKGGAKVDLVIEDCWFKTALNLACFHGYLDIVACLVESGANVNLTTYRNRDMLTPLREAVSGANKNGSDFSVVRYLIDKGAKLDEETGKYSSNKSLKEYLQNIRNLKR